MNHRLRDKSSRSLMSQFDAQSSEPKNSNTTKLFRKFSSLSSSSSTTSKTTDTSNVTESSSSLSSIAKYETILTERVQNDNIESNKNVQLKSESKLKTITKNILSTAFKDKELTTTATTDNNILPINLTRRPSTLNVLNHDQQIIEAKLVIAEALHSWRSKARCNVVPTDRLKELFNELQFNPSTKQISEIIQTAKLFARKGDRSENGLTFGEFCVLAADLKRFRSCNIKTPPSTPPSTTLDGLIEKTPTSTETTTNSTTEKVDITLPTALKNQNNTPEVFLGGSCNPTTWRADVAIPTLDKLGISFYNPQVSHWTPDLMDLEYRAKEKAQVLFFVMDSETRASAGAIEVAYIAGQNARQLVLVLHAYRPEQCINNEQISLQEYTDLSRNQQLLKEMVQRRGIPVLDNISEGLKRTKQILAGVRDPPSSISSILIIIRGAFDRVLSSSINSITAKTKTSKSKTYHYSNNLITLEQCQLALSFLGYAQSFLTLENLKDILLSYKEPLITHGIISASQQSELPQEETQTSFKLTKNNKAKNFFTNNKNFSSDIYLNFDEFCIIAAHLSLLQQEIYEHGCISPIKGTNITPPPIFLANMQETSSTDNVTLRTPSYNNGKRINRTGSLNITAMMLPSSQILNSISTSTVIPKTPTVLEEKPLIINERNNSYDSGTSSPQPPLIHESGTQSTLNSSSSTSCNSYCSGNNINNSILTPLNSKLKYSIGNQVRSSRSSGNFDQILPLNHNNDDSALEDESDSNDSVFSSGSSVNSYLCETKTSFTSLIGKDYCDVYLGGSCFLRTTWRYKIAIPFLNSKRITYHLPALHESIIPSQKLRRWLSEISSKSEDDEISSANYDEKILINLNNNYRTNISNDEEQTWPNLIRKNLYNPSLLDSSRILLFVITNETRSLAPMTLAAHCIGLMYNIVLCVQMLPENNCVIGNEKLTATAIKDYNRGRSYLVDLAKRQGVPVFDDIKEALECVVEKLKASYSRNNVLQNKFLRIL